MPPRFELNSIGLWLWNLFWGEDERGHVVWVVHRAFADGKIELSRSLSGMTAKTRRVHGNNNWVSCENAPPREDSFRRDTLPLDRWNLMVHYAQQRYGTANLNVNLCWSNDFRKFHCSRTSTKGEETRGKLNGLMSNLLRRPFNPETKVGASDQIFNENLKANDSAIDKFLSKQIERFRNYATKGCLGNGWQLTGRVLLVRAPATIKVCCGESLRTLIMEFLQRIHCSGKTLCGTFLRLKYRKKWTSETQK